MDEILRKPLNKGDDSNITEHMAMCTHPLCPGRPGYEHCGPHAYFEEECECVCCGMLEEASSCDIITINIQASKGGHG